MRRIIWACLGLLTLVGLVVGVATFYLKDRAFRLYHGGKYHTQRSLVAPESVAEDARQLDRDLQELQRLHPGLAKVEREFLGQPLEETQSLLYLLGMQAIKNKDEGQWRLITRVLNEIWLHQRQASQISIEQARTLNLFQQRILAFYASSALQRHPGSLPQIDPQAWPGRIQLAHRLLLNYRVKRWENWEVWGGLPNWWTACDVLKRLDQWHAELDSGSLLSPPSAELKPLYEALLPLQKGP
jgi:hypothetical protein